MHNAMIHSSGKCDYSQGLRVTCVLPLLLVWNSKRSLPSAHVRVTDYRLSWVLCPGRDSATSGPWFLVCLVDGFHWERPSEAGPWGSLRCPEAYPSPTQGPLSSPIHLVTCPQSSSSQATFSKVPFPVPRGAPIQVRCWNSLSVVLAS